MVLVEDVAVIVVAELLVSVEPVAGAKVTFEASTCVYPVRSNGRAVLPTLAANEGRIIEDSFALELGALPEPQFGAWPGPPMSQYTA
jgi:hypothetical protein